MAPLADGASRVSSGWRALGTEVSVIVTDPRALAPARASVEAELVAIDLACSRFRADSELARVNAAGGTQRVSPLLLEALTAALRSARLTGGDVDPALGVAIELAGYDRDFTLLPQVGDPSPGATPAERPIGARSGIRLRRRAGWRAIAIDPDRSTVCLPIGLRLDLGATAKALAADRAAQAAAAASGVGVLVNLGGDISIAGPPPAGGWLVRVAEDREAAHGAGQTIALHGGGLATSSTVNRRWRHNGAVMHHILEPARGEPTEIVWRTVSVAAVNCLDANTASTAAIVRGRRAPAWLERHALPSRLVAAGGSITALAGWPPETP